VSDEGCPRRALLERLRAAVARYADRPAVREPQAALTYRDFGRRIAGVRSALDAADVPATGPIGILLERSADAYATMCAAVALGRPYVPLNPRDPASRLADIVRQAGVRAVVCGPDQRAAAAGLGDVRPVALAPGLAADGDGLACAAPADDARTAYILFTSGSTGVPKGVAIGYASLAAFLANMSRTLDYQPGDVATQLCELSFDLSVHEIYLALLSGAALCPARQIDLFNPAGYVAGNAITVWTAVPSLARIALNNGAGPGDLPSLRLCAFNGEALTAELARAWAAVAPNAQIWNTYGPTECTVAVTAQRWLDDPAIVEAGVVAIGRPLPDCTASLLIDGRPQADPAEGAVGELVLDTPQRFPGYLDPSLPSPFLDGPDGRSYYRTGDRVRWRDGRLFHLGRLDSQVKIGGHRIEILEVERRLRDGLGVADLAVVAHPPERPSELVLFAAGSRAPGRLSPADLGLPAYMLPRRTIRLEAMPRSAHGKLDRKALQAIAAAPS
jgi:amino acid adenylation domain-containing protein